MEKKQTKIKTQSLKADSLKADLIQIQARFTQVCKVQGNVEKEILMLLGFIINGEVSPGGQNRLTNLLNDTVIDYRKKSFLIKRIIVLTKKMLELENFKS